MLILKRWWLRSQLTLWFLHSSHFCICLVKLQRTSCREHISSFCVAFSDRVICPCMILLCKYCVSYSDRYPFMETFMPNRQVCLLICILFQVPYWWIMLTVNMEVCKMSTVLKGIRPTNVNCSTDRLLDICLFVCLYLFVLLMYSVRIMKGYNNCI